MLQWKWRDRVNCLSCMDVVKILYTKPQSKGQVISDTKKTLRYICLCLVYVSSHEGCNLRNSYKHELTSRNGMVSKSTACVHRQKLKSCNKFASARTFLIPKNHEL